MNNDFGIEEKPEHVVYIRSGTELDYNGVLHTYMVETHTTILLTYIIIIIIHTFSFEGIT